MRAHVDRRGLLKGLLACVPLALLAARTRAADDAAAPATIQPLVAGVWVSGQIAPAQVDDLKAQGIRTIIALRPDGEEPGQPSSAAVEAAARAAGLGFAHAPVADGEIPQAAVDAVTRALARRDNTVLLYCRSGRRATRTWALAEASRRDGLEAEAIEAVAASTGQSLDDLREQIAARVATRSKLP